MIEKVFQNSRSNEKTIERVIMDENLHYMHMIFGKDEGLPEHFANSNVYMTVVRGTLSIGLNEQAIHEYVAGQVLKIPVKTKMNVTNRHRDVLELIIVKAPAPQA
jgi:quercetin dioxygenase-like cupin family protein